MFVKTKKYIAFFLLFFIIGGFAVGAMPVPAKAQWITTDIPSLGGNIWKALTRVWDNMSKQIAATAFKNALSTFLNKLAYDSAVAVASGGAGQKALIQSFKKNYFRDLGDAVAGEFIDELAQKTGFTSALGVTSLCEPVDLTMKANLLMSFKKPPEPIPPKCSLTKMRQAAQKSAQDDLLEFNAGWKESEGGLNITLSGLNTDQIFQGTQAQQDLSARSEDLTKVLTELHDIMTTIQNAFQVDMNNVLGADKENDLSSNATLEQSSSSAQAVADGQLSRIKELEAELAGIITMLEATQTDASKCIDEYNKIGSRCGNNVATTGEECDISNNFCSSCKITGGAGNDCGGPNEQCTGPNSPNIDGMTCQGLGFAPGSGGSVDCDANCHYKTNNCFPLQAGICTDTSLMPNCPYYTNTISPETSCFDNSYKATQYASELIALVALESQQMQDFIKKIEDKAFADVVNNDPTDIANAFNPEANEMGQFGKIQETLSQKTQDQLEHEKLKTLAEGPCKGVTKPISGEVVTPSAATCATINEALAKSTKGQETFTGTIADAFGIFANTLTSKLMETYFKKGLSIVIGADGLRKCTRPDGTSCKEGEDGGDKTEDVLRSGVQPGRAQAQVALGGLLTASLETGGQVDILSALASCPPEQPALNNCIIDEPFRRVIEKQYTVRQALESYKTSGGSEGLDPKKPFGYILVGGALDEPDFKNGYPYRSMLYLRKYRIIPVGWELAAQYIKDIESPKQVHTLENVVDGFDDPTSPFFGLVDPAWVLKSPQVFCAKQGPGPELISTELQCEKFDSTGQCVNDDYQSRKVSRKVWCADEQTCLEEGESGDCKRYGYCTKELPSWKLGGTQCEKPFASCEGYTNSVTKANYALLENTLNKSDCSQSNVGCQWYCQDAPKMCIGGTRGGQPCDVNNDCASIYCSVGTCVSSGITCSYDNDCGSGATGFCSNNNAISCTTVTVDTDCGVGNQCILCNTGARACVNGDTPGVACTTNAQCGRGVADGVCEEGGVWSCQVENLVADGDMEASGVGAWNSNDGCFSPIYSKSTAYVKSGNQSMSIADNNLVGFCQGRGQTVTLKAGKTYILEAYIKVESNLGLNSHGSLYNPTGNPGDKYTERWYTIDASSEWQHVSYIFKANPPVGTCSISAAPCVYTDDCGGGGNVCNNPAADPVVDFGFRISGDPTNIYVDDVRLYEGDRVNLDRDVKKCEAKDGGCNQFIKVLPGTNLIGNSGFEDDDDTTTLTLPTGGNSSYLNKWYFYNNTIGGDLKVEIDNTIIHSGKNSLKVNMYPTNNDYTLGGLWITDNSIPSRSGVPTGFNFDMAKSYTLSAWIYNNDPATVIRVGLGNATLASWKESGTNSSGEWERVSLTISAEENQTLQVNEIRIFNTNGNLTDFYIDDIQLEEGDTSSNYVQYGASNQAYLNGRRLSCLKEEVDCNLYTPTDGGDPIPAVAKTQDLCPAECAGYASFNELPTFFAPSGNSFPNLIPKTAVSCSASVVGCEEFTNLDTVSQGGEGKEYYTYLRQCAKPGETTEATYYTWEGSEEAGFQLRAWRLKSDPANGNRPYSTNGVDCINPGTDPDCRTFYDQNGNIFTEELSSTIFISTDCHPLRRTLEGSQADCTGSGGYQWDDPDNDGNGTCYYKAIPSQGLKCQAKYAGCREYRGAAGNNLRVLLNDDFEDLTSQDWSPSSLSSESLTVGGRSYFLYADSGTGNFTMQKNVADQVAQGKTYVLEFWAKWNQSEPNGDGDPLTYLVNARFKSLNAATIPFIKDAAISIGDEWNKYSLGPVVFDRSVETDETLEIFPADLLGANCTPEPVAGSSDCAGQFYLDSIVLREITDNPYLIKDSWKTPVSCMIDPEISKTFPTLPTSLSADITAAEVGSLTVDNSLGFTAPGALAIDGEIIEYQAITGNIFGVLTRGANKTGPAAHLTGANVWPVDEGAQLGCKEYADRLNQKAYLRSFSYLCGEDKVGCTEMFNTYNSSTMYEETLKGEYIPRDAVEYIVDNPKLYCDTSFKGCEKLGQPALGQNGEVTSWGETYLINDPDQYDQIACESSENMCSEFITRTGGTTYFKDPKDALCEYHPSINIEGVITKGWFKKGVVPAALGGLVFYDSDGVGGPDTYAHLECANISGVWDETKWTYSCPNDQVGCTEYQTPAVSALQTGSQFIKATVGGASGTTFQGSGGSPIISYRFDVLESGSYNLSLSTQNWNSGTKGDDIFNIDGIRHFLAISIDGVQKASLNNASAPLAPPALLNAQLTTVSLGNLERGDRIISINWPNDWNDPIGGAPVGDSNLQINSLILSKSAGNNYYNLEQGVDTASCTGVVDPEKGCVAFYDATNPILNIKSSAVGGNAFAPAACQKCSLDTATCSTSTTCDPAAENCCCTNNAVVTNPCDSNTILKVKADRQCAEWLACTESEKTTDSKGNIIEMCKKRQACKTAGEGVECDPSDTTFEAKQNQTFDDPVAIDVSPLGHAGVVADANLRSGYFKAGAHWSRVCQGNASLSCQVDADCGADGPCIDRAKTVCSLNPGKACVSDSDCLAGEGICGVFIEGYYPYAKMEQTGYPVGVANGAIAFEDDFETYQSGETLPQCSADASIKCPGLTDAECKPPITSKDAGSCLYYWTLGSSKATNKEFKFGGQSLLVYASSDITPLGTTTTPIESKDIPVAVGSAYVLTVWLNTKDMQSLGALDNALVVEVSGASGAFTMEQNEGEGWKKYIRSFSAAAANLKIRAYLRAGTNGIKSGSKAYVDMISLAPVLEIQSPPDAKTLPENYNVFNLGTPAYSDRSCRIFAKPDALSCKYRERNSGREIQGWRGFCAEADPKNPDYCLQWWPIDLIEGEDISKF